MSRVFEARGRTFEEVGQLLVQHVLAAREDKR